MRQTAVRLPSTKRVELSQAEREAHPRRARQSERLAGFRLECMAGFVGIRTRQYTSVRGGPPILVADSTRVRDRLGWCPCHSDLAA